MFIEIIDNLYFARVLLSKRFELIKLGGKAYNNEAR